MSDSVNVVHFQFRIGYASGSHSSLALFLKRRMKVLKKPLPLFVLGSCHTNIAQVFLEGVFLPQPWRKQQGQDKYFRQAKSEGYSVRSTFELIKIKDRFHRW